VRCIAPIYRTTGAPRAHSLHLDTRLFNKSVEHTPGERAMGAAALKSQVMHFTFEITGPNFRKIVKTQQMN
jgi:hypothetical protein